MQGRMAGMRSIIAILLAAHFSYCYGFLLGGCVRI